MYTKYNGRYIGVGGKLKLSYMRFTTEIKDIFKIAKSRFLGLRRELKVFLILSIISILSIEFIFNKFQPRYQFQYDFGVVYLKLCYSFFSAFVFYYLVVYAPRERRRVKSFRYLNNKLLKIDDLVNDILLSVFREVNPKQNTIIDEIKLEEIKIICKQINPKSPITINLKENAIFKNHYDFINFKTNKIKLLISELIILNELIDEDLFRGLTNINDVITHSLTFDINIFANTDSEFLSHSLYDLHFESKEMTRNFLKNYRHKYDFQYNKFERIRNQQRK